ncbi:MAG: Sugar or sugar phosphate isomerase/epimerase/dehydrotase [uncultured Thermomicrobiales bacterium]|uniref:Sugar or sugar phosphate isomerase/epimerase/dehydrotase n=1 Tax=uncultured Thermomicrobiales bacterium TaxID=1645740 RepID=A0A6J4ULK9_9BACT|nr:MAG: Sugar or sugar phosphate isomerase/epimerase/dehydrotase [uncultured Thermomicrobiales bacterium]
MTFRVALQAYTVREELAVDYLGTLTAIAEIGYEGVELGPPPAEISLVECKDHMTQIGLQVVGSHAGLQQLTDDLGAQVDYLHTMGGRYLGLSHRFASRQDVLEAAKRFNEIGDACRDAGIQLLYHNHNWEFTKFDGQVAYDLLLDATDPALVKMELDTYWVQRAGEDPVDYLNRLRGRCPLLHIKDMEAGEEQFFAEVGEGVLDWDAIFQAADAAGTQWLVVEQDQCRRPVFESIAISYRNLQEMEIT